VKRLASLLWLIALAAPALAEAPVIRLVDFETTVNPITAMRITTAIEDAEKAGDDLVLIKLDTPGGLVDSMEDIVKSMLAAKVPIVVWVGPAGAHAASAGFFVLISADVAAMAPGTRTGAASTVFATGGGDENNVLLKKSNEDLAALIRSIADRRGRNVEACERAVLEAKAYEEKVALDEGLIDLLAASREELLEKLDTMEIDRFDGSKVVLRTAGATFVTSQFSLRHEFMELLAIPAIAYGLFLLGVLGIYVELTHPGMVLPGVVGAMALILFALAAQVLPISAIGILLIVLALVMFILEIKVTSYGMLTLGGLACLIIGSWMLVDGPIPALRVPWGVFLPASLAIGGLCAFALRLAVKAQRARVGTGVEGLAGATGTVTEDLMPEGKIFVHGEIWNATAAGEPIEAGRRVRVTKVEDMWLTVEAINGPTADRS
jgi:membrane-bound serine protease (ClpP class)